MTTTETIAMTKQPPIILKTQLSNHAEGGALINGQEALASDNPLLAELESSPIANQELIARGYRVLPDRSHPGKFGWTQDNGLGTVKCYGNCLNFESEKDAWDSARDDFEDERAERLRLDCRPRAS